MKLYQILKINKKIKSPAVKLIGILFANILGFRHFSIRIDPTLGCNLACRMCYFSSLERRKQLKGFLSEQELDGIARVMFPRALQVTIGCGAEPTIHKNFIKLAQLAKKYKVPDISLVTNGQLLTYHDLELLAEIGIDEIIISMHGVTAPVYESFMVNASFNRLLERLGWLEEIKKKKCTPLPHLRINYTVNSENLNDLKLFFDIMGSYTIKTLQIRPVVDIGGEYSYPIQEHQKSTYIQLIEDFTTITNQRNIRFLSNTKDIEFKKDNQDGVVAEAVYCYISPNTATQLGMEWNKVSFSQYLRKVNWRKNLLKSIFIRDRNALNSKMAKYNIQ